MSVRVAYLDTSAFVKLVVAEPESAALQRVLRRWHDRASATLLRAEAVRALRRSGNHSLVGKARRLFATIQMVRIDEPLLDRAGELDPDGLRTLDAIHLAAAMAIGPDLGVVLTYDARLAAAADAAGMNVEAPA